MNFAVYIATSLDGYIAKEDGGIDWLINFPNPEKSDFGFAVFLEEIDAILMGRKTYETVLGFEDWPYKKPVFVLTNSLNAIPSRLAGKVELIHGDDDQAVATLEAKGFQLIYVDGGGLIQSFLKNDRINRLIVSTIPVLLGTGISLYPKPGRMIPFKHVKTEVFSNGIVKSEYRSKE